MNIYRPIRSAIATACVLAMPAVAAAQESPASTSNLAAFVDNLTDEEYRVYAFDSSLFAGVVAAVYGKPRTWGVSG